MNEPAPWTVLRMLEWTTGYLRDRGSASPRLDAEVLLAAALGWQRIDLYTSYDREVDEARRGTFREFVRRRAEGMPVAYLVGQKEFYSRSFRVTPDVLIPRPETEFVIVELLDVLAAGAKAKAWRMLDIGTGSGILAITAALELPKAEVFAVDISAAALDVARNNVATHRLEERVKLISSDLFSSLDPGQPFDVIVSNPPYVSEADFTKLQPGVRDFEPKQALVAGTSGMEAIQRILKQAPPFLKPGGWLIVEMSPMLRDTISAQLADDRHWTDIAFRCDLSQLPRVVRARRSPDA